MIFYCVLSNTRKFSSIFVFLPYVKPVFLSFWILPKSRGIYFSSVSFFFCHFPLLILISLHTFLCTVRLQCIIPPFKVPQWIAALVFLTKTKIILPPHYCKKLGPGDRHAAAVTQSLKLWREWRDVHQFCCCKNPVFLCSTGKWRDFQLCLSLAPVVIRLKPGIVDFVFSDYDGPTGETIDLVCKKRSLWKSFERGSYLVVVVDTYGRFAVHILQKQRDALGPHATFECTFPCG